MKKLLAGLAILLSIFVLFPSVVVENPKINSVSNQMPLVTDDPLAVSYNFVPQPHRSIQYRKYLAASVKIATSNVVGSGTIIYYDSKTGYAYVQSCGHLWNGYMSATEGRKRKLKARVITWYHNNKKLTKPKSYPADVLYFYKMRGKDISLLKFKPDWKPNYFPIAPEDYIVRQGQRYHSCGADGGNEVARYDIEVAGYRDVGKGRQDLVTRYNSPRRGRSGGGLLSSDGYYVAICWGTSDYAGTGQGYFTPLNTIRKTNQAEGFGFLNEVGHSLARKLPIIDHDEPQGKYPNDYIPLPF